MDKLPGERARHWAQQAVTSRPPFGAPYEALLIEVLTTISSGKFDAELAETFVVRLDRNAPSKGATPNGSRRLRRVGRLRAGLSSPLFGASTETSSWSWPCREPQTSCLPSAAVTGCADGAFISPAVEPVAGWPRTCSKTTSGSFSRAASVAHLDEEFQDVDVLRRLAGARLPVAPRCPSIHDE